MLLVHGSGVWCVGTLLLFRCRFCVLMMRTRSRLCRRALMRGYVRVHTQLNNKPAVCVHTHTQLSNIVSREHRPGQQRLTGTQALDSMWRWLKASTPAPVTSTTGAAGRRAINDRVMQYAFAWQWRSNCRRSGQELWEAVGALCSPSHGREAAT